MNHYTSFQSTFALKFISGICKFLADSEYFEKSLLSLVRFSRRDKKVHVSLYFGRYAFDRLKDQNRSLSEKKDHNVMWEHAKTTTIVEAISSQFWPNPGFCVRKLKFRVHVHDGVYFHYRLGDTLVPAQNNPWG